jgi:hypothetical protein
VLPPSWPPLLLAVPLSEPLPLEEVEPPPLSPLPPHAACATTMLDTSPRRGRSFRMRVLSPVLFASASHV